MKAEPVCGATEAHCRCILWPHDNTGPHVCVCTGSWEYRGDEFIIHAWPDPNFGRDERSVPRLT